MSINTAKETLLTNSLDKNTNFESLNSVNPEGYLTQLDVLDSSNQEIQDLKKLRVLIRSLINTNPYQPQSWLAASRIEEKDNNIKAAKEILKEACVKCPDSEDIWIEAARLETYENSKEILKKAAKHLPKSVKIWLAASSKEINNENKVKVLKKALESNPESVKLWKEIVSLSSEENAKKYLEKAVVCAPHSLELWLALAKLKPYMEARKTLNNARKQLPSEPIIWITCAKLEETQGNLENVNELIKRGVKTLSNNGVSIIREDWIKEAIILEQSGSVLTAKSIIKNCLNIGLEQDQKIKTFTADLQLLFDSQCKESFRFMSQLVIEQFPKSKKLWKTVVFIEKQYADRVLQVIRNACNKSENSSKLWIFYLESSEKSEIFQVFLLSIEKYDQKAKVYLAAYDLLMKNFCYSDAEEVLRLAKEKCYCAEIVKKMIDFYRQLENIEKAKEIGMNAINDFPNDTKLYIKVAKLSSNSESKNFISDACKKFLNCGKLWILLSEIEEKANDDLKARYILEKGRNISNDVEVFIKSIKFELVKNNNKAAEIILNKALQVFPNNGKLWSYAVELTDSKLKKAKIADALEKSPDCPYLLLTVAKIFQFERKFEKARGWYEKALFKGSWLGDVWVFYYNMELKIGEIEKAEKILERSKNFEIRKGEIWKLFRSKDSNQEIIIKAANTIA